MALLGYLAKDAVPLFYEQCPPATMGLLVDFEAPVVITLTIKSFAISRRIACLSFTASMISKVITEYHDASSGQSPTILP